MVEISSSPILFPSASDMKYTAIGRNPLAISLVIPGDARLEGGVNGCGQGWCWDTDLLVGLYSAVKTQAVLVETLLPL